MTQERFKVFLSYKQTDKNGNMTPEVSIAEKLYESLVSKGIKTFYSKQTIGMLGEAKYKEAIDDALDEVSVLVAVGSSSENLNSNWVKYEWDSFYGDILSGRKDGQLISYIKGMDIGELPRTLRQLQTFDSEKNDVEEVCSFIVNSLQSYAPDAQNQNKEIRIATINELKPSGITEFDLASDIIDNIKLQNPNIPEEIVGSVSQCAKFLQRYPDLSSFLIDENNRVVGNFRLIGLNTEQAKLMSDGNLIDCDITTDNSENIYDQGCHVGYLTDISINASVESSELYQDLWDSFVTMLKNLANNDGIFFSKIYYKAFLPEHEAKVAARGFRFCCQDNLFGKVFVHDMLPDSTLLALDPELAEIYLSNKPEQVSNNNNIVVDMEAMSAHLDFWKRIEELFYLPKYCRLKKYFMGAPGVPQNTAEHKIGLGVAEWLRDILQYSSALLPYLPHEQQQTHYQFEQQILNSELIKESMGQYQFTTEDETLSVDIHSDSISIKSIVTFAHIWLDIDMLFLDADLIDLKPYFYEQSDTLPTKDLELCEALALRILTGMKVSEDQLRHIPEEFVESYYDYKYSICNSAIMQQVLNKYPFIKKELNWE